MRKNCSIQIDDDVARVLTEVATFNADLISLGKPGSLSRGLYDKTNKVLELLGFKWVRVRKGHVHQEGKMAKQVIDEALSAGVVVDMVKLLQFYPTVPDIADKMVDLLDIRSDSTILEPSAGHGALIEAIFRKHEELLDKIITAIEVDPAKVKILKEKQEEFAWGPIDIVCADFLSIEPNKVYDFVIANPPFAEMQWKSHLFHALRFLKPGGIAVFLIAGNPKPEVGQWGTVVYEQYPIVAGEDTKAQSTLVAIKAHDE